MIVEKELNGKKALVQYLDSDFQPVDTEEEAEIVKIMWPDGKTEYMAPDKPEAENEDDDFSDLDDLLKLFDADDKEADDSSKVLHNGAWEIAYQHHLDAALENLSSMDRFIASGDPRKMAGGVKLVFQYIGYIANKIGGVNSPDYNAVRAAKAAGDALERAIQANPEDKRTITQLATKAKIKVRDIVRQRAIVAADALAQDEQIVKDWL